MTIKVNYAFKREDIPENWRDCVVVLWREDDAPVPDKERTSSAFERITGNKEREDQRIHREDCGDVIYDFYNGGWVCASTYDGGWVGILVADAKLIAAFTALLEKSEKLMDALSQGAERYFGEWADCCKEMQAAIDMARGIERMP